MVVGRLYQNLGGGYKFMRNIDRREDCQGDAAFNLLCYKYCKPLVTMANSEIYLNS